LGLPDGEEIITLAFFVLTQYRRVTDRQTDGQTDGHVATIRYDTIVEFNVDSKAEYRA